VTEQLKQSSEARIYNFRMIDQLQSEVKQVMEELLKTQQEAKKLASANEKK